MAHDKFTAVRLRVASVRQAGWADHIGDKDDFFSALRPPGQVLGRGMGMDVVADHLHGIPVQRQCTADHARLPVSEAAHAVEQVGDAAEPVIQARLHIRKGRIGMSGGNAHARGMEKVAGSQVFREFRGDGDAFDHARIQELSALVQVSPADVRRILRAAFFRVEIGTFQMDARDLREIPALPDKFRGAADRADRGFRAGGHGRRQVGRHPVRGVERRDLQDLLRIRIHRAAAEAAVGMNVDKARQQVLPLCINDFIGRLF